MTREWVHEADVNEDVNPTVTGVKKQLAINKIDTFKAIDSLQRTIYSNNNQIIKKVSELTRTIKHKAELRKVIDPEATEELFIHGKVDHPISEPVPNAGV